jgi:hypothetical protein
MTVQQTHPYAHTCPRATLIQHTKQQGGATRGRGFACAIQQGRRQQAHATYCPAPTATAACLVQRSPHIPAHHTGSEPWRCPALQQQCERSLMAPAHPPDHIHGAAGSHLVVMEGPICLLGGALAHAPAVFHVAWWARLLWQQHAAASASAPAAAVAAAGQVEA